MHSEHSASSPISHFLSLKDGSNPVNLDPDSTTEFVLAEPYKPVSRFFSKLKSLSSVAQAGALPLYKYP